MLEESKSRLPGEIQAGEDRGFRLNMELVDRDVLLVIDMQNDLP